MTLEIVRFYFWSFHDGIFRESLGFSVRLLSRCSVLVSIRKPHWWILSFGSFVTPTPRIWFTFVLRFTYFTTGAKIRRDLRCFRRNFENVGVGSVRILWMGTFLEVSKYEWNTSLNIHNNILKFYLRSEKGIRSKFEYDLHIYILSRFFFPNTLFFHLVPSIDVRVVRHFESFFLDFPPIFRAFFAKKKGWESKKQRAEKAPGSRRIIKEIIFRTKLNGS